MSYEEDYREPYRAKCVCGRGYLQFYRIHLSNDWGQEKRMTRLLRFSVKVVRKNIIMREITEAII